MIGISMVAAWTLFAVAEGPGTYFVPPKGADNVVSQPECRADAPRRTVAFLGGSITEMDGFRPRLMRLLRAKYPSVDFVEISSGLSSTCSDTGAMRFRADVLEKGIPDLLIVDEAVNDDQDGHFDRRRMVRGMEGILRSARAANPSMALVVALFVNHGQFNRLVKGETPLQYAVHAEVARHYGAALADVGSALAASAKAGCLGWEGYRDCHPSPEGCDFAAAVVLKAVGEVLDPRGAPTPLRLPTRLDPASYDGAAFIPFGRVFRDAAWRVSCPDWAKIPGCKRTRFITGDSLWTETDGATFTVAFRGTALAAILTAGPDAGDIEISVDGGPWTRRGLFTPYSKSLHYPFTAILAEELPAGEHSASVRACAAERDGVRRCAVRIHRLVEVLSGAASALRASDINVRDDLSAATNRFFEHKVDDSGVNAYTGRMKCEE